MQTESIGSLMWVNQRLQIAVIIILVNSFAIVKEQRKKCNISLKILIFTEKGVLLCLNGKTLEKVCVHCKCLTVERGIQRYGKNGGNKRRQNIPRKTEPLLFPNRRFLDEGPSFWFFENRKKVAKFIKYIFVIPRISVWTDSKYSQ